MPCRKEGTLPSETIRITKDQRDALYEQVRTHLAALGDIWIALEGQRDYATAERLAIEFGEDFRLMADLGWNPEDSRERVALTMPRHDLMEVVRRLRDEARGALSSPEERRSREKCEREVAEFEATAVACDSILAALAADGEGEIHAHRA